MATPTTISQTLPAPILEGALTAFTKKLEPLIGQQIQTSAYAPKIAAESQLQQQARTSTGGLESLLGPQAYQQFMSPYQQEVIDTTLAEMDRQAAIQRQGIGQSAIQAGAFGGGREGVQMAEYDVNTLARRAQTQAQLLQQGYLQAQQQAVLDAAQVAAREAQYEPFTRLGLVGQQLAQIQPGAFPTQTVGYQQPQAPASPLATALGVGTGIASIGSKLGLFG